MAKIELKGRIIAVLPVESINGKDKVFKKQSIVLKVAGRTDDFGTAVSPDELWKIDIVGDERIDKFKFGASDVLKQGTFIVWINSNELPPKEGIAPMYIINAALSDWKEYVKS